MLVERIYLRNYRVFEAELELELPPGLIGVYGPNGAGKSYLVEAIRWVLFGHTRTAKEEIRTAGVGADCVCEIGFEHEDHHYLVRRVLTGAGPGVKAQAEADGSQVADGARDVSRYVQSVLGLGDDAFRASVFAEQKQLAAFSARRPAERRDLVLSLLGVRPLDDARDQARRDARTTREQFDRLRLVLPDLAERQRQVETTTAAVILATDRAASAVADEHDAETRRQQALEAARELDGRARDYDDLLEDGRRARRDRDERAVRVDRLELELAELASLAGQLDGLDATAIDAERLQGRVKLLDELGAADAALARIVIGERPAPADVEGARALRAAAASAAARLSETEALAGAAEAECARAAASEARSADLSGEADCPLCGQSLGDAFNAVREHRARELAEAEARLAARRADADAAKIAAYAALQRATEAEQEETVSRVALDCWQVANAERSGALNRRNEAVAALGGDPAPGERAELATELTVSRQALQFAAEIRGSLRRLEPATVELAAERSALSAADEHLEELRRKVQELRFDPRAVEAAAKEVDAATRLAEDTGARRREHEASAQRAREALAGAEASFVEARAAHERLDELAEEARHLGRTSQLLSSFRNSVVASIGPRLGAQAAELFAELTDHEYDRLEVDPETYELQLRDQGLAYGMDRFSGSETDLANLALRVAISEQVRFQSGGAVGLLVLDEVFGPLDDDRRERMLAALERLRGRFRQIVVVTHAEDVKQRLPQAIEVVKLDGRRATARLI